MLTDYEGIELRIDIGSLRRPTGKYAHLLDEFDGLTTDGDRVKHVYASYGVAASVSQEFEVTLGNLALLDERALGNIKSCGEADAFADRFERRTMGAMLAHVRQRVRWQDDLDRLLRDALSARNSMAHGFFFRHSVAMMNDVGRRRMIAELAQIAGILRVADRALSTVVQALMDVCGIPKEVVTKAHQDLLAEAEAEARGGGSK